MSLSPLAAALAGGPPLASAAQTAVGLAHRAGALDPSFFAEAARLVPQWLGAPLLLFGLILAGFGSRGLGRRPVIAGVGAAVGLALAAYLPAWAGRTAVPWVVAASLAVAGLLSPALGMGLAGGIVGGLIGDHFAPADHRVVVLLGSAFSAGALGALTARWTAGVTSACAGAVLATVGGIALLPAAQQTALATYPAAPLLPTVVVAIAGAAFQIARPEPRKPLGRRRAPSRGAQAEESPEEAG